MTLLQRMIVLAVTSIAALGPDHPLAWTNCIGKGRSFYSAIGHKPETYSHPQHVAMLQAAIEWAATAKNACPAK